MLAIWQAGLSSMPPVSSPSRQDRAPIPPADWSSDTVIIGWPSLPMPAMTSRSHAALDTASRLRLSSSGPAASIFEIRTVALLIPHHAAVVVPPETAAGNWALAMVPGLNRKSTTRRTAPEAQGRSPQSSGMIAVTSPAWNTGRVTLKYPDWGSDSVASKVSRSPSLVIETMTLWTVRSPVMDTS